MAILKLRIDSILNGWSPAMYFNMKGTYNSSLAIDPDFPISSTDIRTSGLAVPIGYSKFSGVNVNAPIINIITNPKNTLTYVVLNNGRLISYNSALGVETLIAPAAGGTCSGAAYYNNYIYLLGTSTGTDVSRYGPLDGVPALTDTVWTGATLGTQTALTNTTYPSFRGVALPNHWAQYNPGDNALYFCDFKNGQGYLNKIKTTRVTNEGDTNSGSAYQVLALPFGYYPMDLVNYNINDLAIVGFQSTDTVVNQGNGWLILWDTTNTSGFYRNIPLADPFATAIDDVNGKLLVFSGNAQSGMRISHYVGGDSLHEIVYQEEGYSPFPGAIDAKGNRVVWGSWITYPVASSVVFGFNSKNVRLSQEPVPIHAVMTPSTSGVSQIVTALKFAQQSSNVAPKMVVGWHDGTPANGLDKYSSSATLGSTLRFMFNIGRKFRIMKLRIPLAGLVDANTQITTTLYNDDASHTIASLPVINNATYGGRRKIIMKMPGLAFDVTGSNNFILEFVWGLTTPIPISFPILMDCEVEDDEPDSF
ncbi:MAG TPA: hypothetical protein VF974_04890 [Patescibacteria group bacterium]